MDCAYGCDDLSEKMQAAFLFDVSAILNESIIKYKGYYKVPLKWYIFIRDCRFVLLQFKSYMTKFKGKILTVM